MPRHIERANVRAGLKTRSEPWWGSRLAEGRYIGFRKIDGATGSWIARARLDDDMRERLGLAGKSQQTYKDLGAVSDKFDYDDACRAAREWFETLDAGVVSNKPFTVEDACTDYIDELRRQKRDSTADDATWRFERGGITGTAFGRTELAKLSPAGLKKWRDGLMAEDDEGRAMGKSGANREFTTLRAALNLAVENRRATLITAQAWRAVKQFKGADGHRGDEHFLTIEQRRALLAAATGPNPDAPLALRAFIEAALLIGCRPGELAKATRGDFNARAKTLKLSHRKGDGTVRERNVPLTGAALTLFERLAKSKLPAALLLTRDDGKPWTRIEWSRQIRAAAEGVVVKDAHGKVLKDDGGRDVTLPADVCMYSARHTYITQALGDGMTTGDVARVTGTSLTMIEKNYSKFVEDAVRERIARVQML